MASTFYRGKTLRFKFEDKLFLHATSCKLTVAMKLEEISTKDTDGTVSIPSTYSFSGSADALLHNLPSGDTTHVTADTLLQYQLAGTEIDIEFTTDITGDIVYTGKAFIDNFDVTADVESVAKVTISFKGNGDLTRSTVS